MKRAIAVAVAQIGAVYEAATREGGAMNRLYRKQCHGKKGFLALRDAESEIWRSHPHVHMSVYRCPHCGIFHIGHTKTKGRATKPRHDKDFLSDHIDKILSIVKPARHRDNPTRRLAYLAKRLAARLKKRAAARKGRGK